jgi:hypothetical protein
LPALGQPAIVRAAAGTVTLTTANDVFLDTVQRDKKILGCLIEIRWKVPSEATMPLVHTNRNRPQ